MSESQALSAVPTDLADRLRNIAREREALDVAQFQFIGFDAIRAAYGERWPEEKDRIRGVAEGFLRRRIDGADLLIRADGGFLVVFGSATGAEAEVAAGQLSHGLNEFFLGGDGPTPRFSVASSSVPVKELTDRLGDVEIISPEQGPDPAETFGLSQLDWRFQPVWDVKRETLSSWYVTPYITKSGVRLPGYQFEGVSARPHHFAAVALLQGSYKLGGVHGQSAFNNFLWQATELCGCHHVHFALGRSWYEDTHPDAPVCPTGFATLDIIEIASGGFRPLHRADSSCPPNEFECVMDLPSVRPYRRQLELMFRHKFERRF